MYQMQPGFNLGTKSIWNLLEKNGDIVYEVLWHHSNFQIRNLNCVRIRKEIISLRWLNRNICLFPLSLARISSSFTDLKLRLETKVEWIQEIQPQKKASLCAFVSQLPSDTGVHNYTVRVDHTRYTVLILQTPIQYCFCTKQHQSCHFW